MSSIGSTLRVRKRRKRNAVSFFAAAASFLFLFCGVHLYSAFPAAAGFPTSFSVVVGIPRMTSMPTKMIARRGSGSSSSPSLFRNNRITSTRHNATRRKRNDYDDATSTKQTNRTMGVFKKSPGAAILAPFVFLFGLDLVANVAVVTKRSLEVFFTGEYTVWTPWQ